MSKLSVLVAYYITRGARYIKFLSLFLSLSLSPTPMRCARAEVLPNEILCCDLTTVSLLSCVMSNATYPRSLGHEHPLGGGPHLETNL